MYKKLTQNHFVLFSSMLLVVSCLGEQPSNIKVSNPIISGSPANATYTSIEECDPSDPNCEPSVTQPDVIIGDIKSDDPLPQTPDTAVCDPLKGKTNSNNSTLTTQNGLKVELRSPKDNNKTSAWENLDFYLSDSNADTISSELYFSEVNIPTRPFTEGFISGNGEKLKNNSGEDLEEYFSLLFKSEIALGTTDTDEQYEFAFISDDGIRLIINGDEYLEYTGKTAQRMTCAPTSTEIEKSNRWITLSSLQKKPIEIQYFQGPRTEIALVALWRKKSDAIIHGHENTTGCVGSKTFFNTQTSAPQTEWNNLIAKGWSVIPPEVFFIPGQAENPCVVK